MVFCRLASDLCRRLWITSCINVSGTRAVNSSLRWNGMKAMIDCWDLSVYGASLAPAGACIL